MVTNGLASAGRASPATSRATRGRQLTRAADRGRVLAVRANIAAAELSQADESTARPPVPIESPAAWYGRDMTAHPERWTYCLTDGDIEQLAEISEVPFRSHCHSRLFPHT